MGAEWTIGHHLARARGNAGIAPDAVPESRHVMGTTRMGTDPATSVVDPTGRVHGVDNLVVADSSVFVTASGLRADPHPGRARRPGRAPHALTPLTGSAWRRG